jgi:hypothetical protein
VVYVWQIDVYERFPMVILIRGCGNAVSVSALLRLLRRTHDTKMFEQRSGGVLSVFRFTNCSEFSD